MFTGIIQKLGTVTSISTVADTGTLTVEIPPWDTPYELGESIAVQGVCLTIVSWENEKVTFDVLKETFDRTALGHLNPSGKVNIERALRAGDALGGHFVQGHVDGTGSILQIEPVGRDRRITVSFDPTLRPYIAYKGSITLDGISLTVAQVTETSFDVHIIPHTLAETSLQQRAVGDDVNLEVDVLAKYVVNASHLKNNPLGK